MKEIKAQVLSPTGLHARPASLFVTKAQSFRCRITVEVDGRSADAKSILSLLALGASAGMSVVIRAEGPDEVEAVTELASLLASTETRGESGLASRSAGLPGSRPSGGGVIK